MAKKKEKKYIIISILILLIIPIIFAQDSVDAEGGFITKINISETTRTSNWQGFAGNLFFIPPNSTSVNATGGNVNQSDFQFELPCIPISISGFIIFSNSSKQSNTFVPGNLSLLDNIIKTSTGDSAKKTFNSTSTFIIGGVSINNVPTTYTFIDNKKQKISFREGYFNDNWGNLLFLTDVYENIKGYNGSYFDFQVILPSPNSSTTQYFVSADLDIVCPTPTPPTQRTGGGGGLYWEFLRYNCSEWSECIDDLQYRTCTLIDSKGIKAILPPLVRKCISFRGIPTILEEPKIIKEIKNSAILMKLENKKDFFIKEKEEIPVVILNPGKFSFENIEVSLHSPELITKATALHKKHFFYSLFFGIVPRYSSLIESSWKLKKTHLNRLLPETKIFEHLEITAPIMYPSDSTAYITIRSSGIPLISKKINLSVNARPFKIFFEKKERYTKLYLIINNEMEKNEKIEVEVDFNNGRQTAFAEIYNLQLDENKVMIFTHDYYTNFDFNSVTARYKNKKYIGEVI